MDLQKAKILLGKINALYTSMSADAGNIADIEKDLMRSYLRQLYELFLDGTAEQGKNQSTRSSADVEVIRPSSKPSTTTRTNPPADQPPSEPVRATPIPEKTSPKQEVYQAPRIIDLPDSLKDLTEEEAPAPKTVSKPAPEPEVVKPEKAASSEGGDELENLFEQPQAKELSDKLSELPIPDLTKAMGLNEIVFTITELFGGDQEAFKATMQSLNQLQSFEQARDFLLHGVARQFEWAAKERKKKAKAFVKLVRRRYS